MSRQYSDLSNTLIHFKRKYGTTYLPLILSTIITEEFSPVFIPNNVKFKVRSKYQDVLSQLFFFL